MIRMLQIAQQVSMMEAAAEALGVALDDPEALLWSAAVGATQSLWRNTAIEDWHAAEGGLNDGEMLRANASTVRLVHDLLKAGAPWPEIAEQVSSGDRLLPDGRTLRQYAGKRLAHLRRESLAEGRMFARIEASTDRRASLLFATMYTTFSGSDWHGMPTWPARVDAFCRAVQDPTDMHWNLRSLESLGPQPQEISDVNALRGLLLDGPDRLTADAAIWCIRAMLGFIHAPQ